MKLKVVVHKADEGGYWAEVPAVRGCFSQGETMEDLLENIKESIEGCLEVREGLQKYGEDVQILEVAV